MKRLLLILLMCSVCFGFNSFMSNGLYRVENDETRQSVEYNYDLPVRVPDNVGVVCLVADDILQTSYVVLYRECLKRGIPFSVAVPSIMSNSEPIGCESVETVHYTRATDEQLAMMVTRGGACFLNHSLSHGDWESSTDTDWFYNEICCGVDYQAEMGEIYNHALSDTIDRENKTVGDRIADVIQDTSSNVCFETDDTGALYLSSQGFAMLGTWWQDGEGEAVNMDNTFWNVLHAKYGKAVTFDDGDYFWRIPRTTPYTKRVDFASLAASTVTDMIDQCIETGTAIELYAHEFLDSGETYDGDGDGSQKAGKTGWTSADQTVEYTDLTTILDYIETKVNAGTLKAMGLAGAMVAERGTPVNMLMADDFTYTKYNDSLIPTGWGIVRPDTDCNPLHVEAGTGDDTTPYVSIDRGASETDNNIGWWTMFQNNTKCESFMLTGKFRVASGLNEPLIRIFGATNDAPATHTGSSVSLHQVLSVEDGTLDDAGLFAQPLYVYDFSGAVDLSGNTVRARSIIALNLDDSQNFATENGGDSTSVLVDETDGDYASLSVGSYISFKTTTNYTSVYEVEAIEEDTPGAGQTKVTFSATFDGAGEAVDNGDYIVIMDWIPFRIPFNLPKPLSRCGIILSCGAQTGTSPIHYADVKVEPIGPSIDALDNFINNTRID
ncbi:MAG TPA: hypothetical protein HPP87_10485 [Planctomycetes bacterium]|nr:hypothetical protein [Planctomycetota bacterium]